MGEEPGVEVEVWSLPPAAFGVFVAAIPAPLDVGNIMLADGVQVSGFLCEAYALAVASEMIHLGGWRAYGAQGMLSSRA